MKSLDQKGVFFKIETLSGFPFEDIFILKNLLISYHILNIHGHYVNIGLNLKLIKLDEVKFTEKLPKNGNLNFGQNQF